MGSFLSRLQDLAPALNPQHRSLHSAFEKFIIFENGTQHCVALFWLDYHAKCRHYVTLRPNSHRHLQSSFLTHPWQFEALPDYVPPTYQVVSDADLSAMKNIVLVDAHTWQNTVYPTSDPIHEVLIIESTPVPWRINNHVQYFPKEYKNVVKTVLLCQYRLRKKSEMEKKSLADINMVSSRILFFVSSKQLY